MECYLWHIKKLNNTKTEGEDQHTSLPPCEREWCCPTWKKIIEKTKQDCLKNLTSKENGYADIANNVLHVSPCMYASHPPSTDCPISFLTQDTIAQCEKGYYPSSNPSNDIQAQCCVNSNQKTNGHVNAYLRPEL